MARINEDNWLVLTIDFLEDLKMEWQLELENVGDEDRELELNRKLKELESLIKYLNKTN